LLQKKIVSTFRENHEQNRKKVFSENPKNKKIHMISESHRTTHHNLLKLFQFAYVAQATYSFFLDWSILLFLYHLFVAAVIGRGLTDPRTGLSGGTINDNNNNSNANSNNRQESTDVNQSNTSSQPSSPTSASNSSAAPSAVTAANTANLNFAEDFMVRRRLFKAFVTTLPALVIHYYFFFYYTRTNDINQNSKNEFGLISSRTNLVTNIVLALIDTGKEFLLLRRERATSFSSPKQFFFSRLFNATFQNNNVEHHQESMLLQYQLMSSSVVPTTFAIDRAGYLWMLFLDIVRFVLAFCMVSVDCNDEFFKVSN
jgi:hypothetical protein